MPTPRTRRSFLAAIALAAAFAAHRGTAAPSGAHRGTAADSGEPTASGARIPVLVELFTSEGCSSCPPADAVLALLLRTQPVDGVELIGLSEHVDYWNSASFRDPFSSPLSTDRQERYAAVFGRGRIYTPQAVIGGKREALGSDEAGVRNAALAAARDPAGRAVLRARAAGGEVALRLQIGSLPEHGQSDLWVGLIEDGLSSEVSGGENAGRTLRHAAVVRSLRNAGAVEGLAATAEARLALAAGWRRAALRAVAFVQERESRRILAAAQAPLEP